MIPKSLTIVERTMLANQFRLLASTTGDDYYTYKAEILEFGYTGLYDDVFSCRAEEVPVEICMETYDMLNMFGKLNESMRGMSEQQLNGIRTEVLVFCGFDKKRDEHYHFMQFLIEKTERYAFLSAKCADEACEKAMARYRRMLGIYNALKDSQRAHYTLDELKMFEQAALSDGQETPLHRVG